MTDRPRRDELDRPDQALVNSVDAFVRWRLVDMIEAAPPPPALPGKKTDQAEPRQPPAELDTIHQRLLAKAPPFDSPIKTAKLIELARYSVNSWSRAAVTDLVAWGLLCRHARKAGVSLPATARSAG